MLKNESIVFFNYIVLDLSYLHSRQSQWLSRQSSDPYVRLRHAYQYRSRASFKLLQLFQKYKICIQSSHRILDLGASPGSWSQVIQRSRLNQSNQDQLGSIVAVDLLPMDPIPGVTFIQGDLHAVQDQIEQALGGQADLVVSDMAPPMSGIKGADVPRMHALVRLALQVCQKNLRPGGHLIVKMYQGEGDAGIFLRALND